MLLHESNLDRSQKVPVEPRVNNQDQDFGNLVPHHVDIDKRLTDRRDSMCRDPDAEYSNVDSGDDDDSSPFNVSNSATMLSDQSNPVDDNLHEQLDLEDPEKENEE